MIIIGILHCNDVVLCCVVLGKSCVTNLAGDVESMITVAMKTVSIFIQVH